MIADLIAQARFSKTEIDTATHGECTWFAMAVQEILTERGETCELRACEYRAGGWAHIVVVKGNRCYDIRGKVVAGRLHKEYNTALIKPITRDKIISDLGRHRVRLDAITKWRGRLLGQTSA